jgi:hypothetical protein
MVLKSGQDQRDVECASIHNMCPNSINNNSTKAVINAPSYEKKKKPFNCQQSWPIALFFGLFWEQMFIVYQKSWMSKFPPCIFCLHTMLRESTRKCVKDSSQLRKHFTN